MGYIKAINYVYTFLKVLGKSIYRDFALLNRILKKGISLIWEFLIDIIYRIFPTKEGGIEDELSLYIEKKLIFFSSRIAAFNKYYGEFVIISFITTAIALIVFMVFFIPIYFGYFIYPGIVVDGMAIIMGIFISFGFATILVANLILLVFGISLMEYSVKRLKNSIQRKSSSEDYIYEFETYNSKSKDEEYTIHNESVVRFTRIISYICISGLLVAIIMASGTISEIIMNLQGLQELWGERDIYGVNLLLDVFRAVDTILPFEILALFQPSILKSIIIATVILLWISALQNWQILAQLSVTSKYDWSDITQFELSEEWNNYKILIQIVVYQLHLGNLENMRGELLVQLFTLSVLLPLGIGMSYFYIIVVVSL